MGGSTRLRNTNTVLQLRKIDRVRKEGNDNDPEPQNEAVVPGLSQVAQGDTARYTSSYTRKALGITDAAGEVRDWMLRSELGRDASMDRITEEIVAEFEGVEEDAEMYSVEESELSGTWGEFKKGSGRDIDPSGVAARLDENMEKAAALNMSYVDYVATHLQYTPQPTVDVIYPSNRTLPSGTLNLITTAHAFPVFGLLERCPWSTCWYGLFFEVVAKERSVVVTDLWTQTGMYWQDVRDKMDVKVYTKEGPARGYETTPEAWTLAGEEAEARLQRVNFTLNSNPAYGRLPLHAPLTIPAGQTRSFLLATTQDRGIVLRAAEAGAFTAGEVSDEDSELVIKTGLLPCDVDDLADQALHTVYHPVNAAAFVGVIDYHLLPEDGNGEKKA